MVTVMFEAWRGRYSDSPRSVSEYLASMHPSVERWWVVDSHDHFPADARQIARHSPGYFQSLVSADFLISNDIISRHYVGGRNVTYVQCWHGTPLKAIGFHDNKGGYKGSAAQFRRTVRDVKKWDYLLSPCPIITPILRSAFEYDGKVLEIGIPRNDVLCQDKDNETRSRVRSLYGLSDDDPVVLYAPTWRDDDRDDHGRLAHSVMPDWESIAKALPRVKVLFRTHKNVRGAAPRLPSLIDVCEYPDIADLYLAADALISDYSSAITDFAVTRRPIISYVPDLEHYRQDLRTLYFDYDDWAPGPVVMNTADLIEALEDPLASKDAFRDRYEWFTRTFCPFDDGNATRRLVDAVGLGEG